MAYRCLLAFSSVFRVVPAVTEPAMRRLARLGYERLTLSLRRNCSGCSSAFQMTGSAWGVRKTEQSRRSRSGWSRPRWSVFCSTTID